MEALSLQVDLAVPFDPDEPYMDLLERAEAACNTVAQLKAFGLETEVSQEDKEVSVKLANAYARDPEKVSGAATSTRTSKMTPASLLMVSGILRDFGTKVATNAAQIRNVVTNKLLEESENPDPKVRLKALELLGKISDVGLFSDKTEVTITHQTSDELRDNLRAKLEKMINPVPDYSGPLELDGEVIDVDAELGRTEIT